MKTATKTMIVATAPTAPPEAVTPGEGAAEEQAELEEATSTTRILRWVEWPQHESEEHRGGAERGIGKRRGFAEMPL